MSGKEITIAGGGPAGLAVAHYASQRGIPFELFEAGHKVGGNCSTFKKNAFYYDSGAHRLHDKHPETTSIFKELLGSDLQKIEVPSQIYRDGQFIDFPLSPLNLLRFLGAQRFGKAAGQIIKNKLLTKEQPRDFQALAEKSYGHTIAELFLLEYTEKLWGLPSKELSTEVAGKRLKGLDLKTFIIETFKNSESKTEHLDGSFYYPKLGIGTLFEKLAENSKGSIHLNSPITKIHHESGRLNSISFGQETHEVSQLVNSLPLGLTLKLLNPKPPQEILQLASDIKFRNVILFVLFLDKSSVNGNGSMYFPDGKYPFTRVYEPRNRSRDMAPNGKTSLIAEVPCQKQDSIWTNPKGLSEKIKEQLMQIGFFKESELLDMDIQKLGHAYPILEVNYQSKIKPIFEYLNSFQNLYLTGRNGLFAYSHIHDHMQNGKRIVDELKF
ncbi:MAG: FAD-dependent oxidoreductase [Flavobacteriales bacterium]|nr:FAD-dependent oxidoreductase [Flavobacteriales bacterium]